MSRTEIKVSIPVNTGDLALITGACDVTAVVQDALQLVEKLVYHQSKGHRILIKTSDSELIELVRLIKPGNEEKAKKYFVSKTI